MGVWGLRPQRIQGRALAFLFSLLICPHAFADKLVAFGFSAVNGSSAPILCSATLAHWYSIDVGRAPPGGTVHATMWSEPATGAVYIRNQAAHPMPVEHVWCGFADDAGATTADVRFERRAGVAQAPVTLRCHGTPTGLACRQPGDP